MSTQALQTSLTVAPGQYYHATDPGSPLAGSELVVDRVIRDDLGMLHIVLCDLEGREISLFAEQFEAAVASGYLAVPAPGARASA